MERSENRIVSEHSKGFSPDGPSSNYLRKCSISKVSVKVIEIVTARNTFGLSYFICDIFFDIPQMFLKEILFN